MTIDELQAILPDEAKVRNAFRQDGFIELMKGQFKEGKLPFIHQTTFPNGSQIRLKFYNTVKQVRNSKGLVVPGKESWLSYLEVTVMPVGLKAYAYANSLNQCVWATSKKAADEKHGAALKILEEYGSSLGIDLTNDSSWCEIYSELY